MDRFNLTSLLHRSATLRTTASGAAFVVLAGGLVGIARYLETHITDSFAENAAVVTALVVLEAALFILVERIFKNIP